MEFPSIRPNGANYIRPRDGEALDLPWESLARGDTTIAIYMGLANLSEITGRLIGCGLDPLTPAAAIQSGTTSGQRRVPLSMNGLS